ncbi:MAG TPA: hypothetical protein EYP20_02845 [Aigarchaeota archaeon]|nr:hypothetical protein [Aigarchaeota archaeon]
MEFIPIAEESLGVRSVAAYLTTGDVNILLDPGISLAPKRYGLPPHPAEVERAKQLRKELEQHVKDANILFISHYHRDHYTVPYSSIYMATDEKSYLRIYPEKKILMKAPHDLNYSQRTRYKELLKALEKVKCLKEHADGVETVIGGTRISVSKPLPHGPDNSKTGTVIALTIEEDHKLVFAPDIQGPMSEQTLNHLLKAKPQTLVLGGPPIYLTNAFTPEQLHLSKKNLLKILNIPTLETLVITHHALRQANWREELQEVFTEAKNKKINITTYAELLGREEELLESIRNKLYKEHPPPREYKQIFKHRENI